MKTIGGITMNRLNKEKSPYLLQHASNPVHWFSWGPDAFAQAKQEDKPIFLSIGYSTCHWCHVMAHESFEDAEVAAVLNRDYVCIKVDREERPDIDRVYMEVCQALTGAGGWPLTVMMTPDQKPFWAGTYLPKTGTYGRLGLMELLAAVTEQWRTGRDKLIFAGNQLTDLLNRSGKTGKESAQPEKALLHRALETFENSYDKQWGGFGREPKFPTPHNLLFLLQYALLEKNPSARTMAEHTLVQMFRGGIFDHIGGGFSRYSTDGRWLVPHFEKMLYDNALLAYAYLEAYQMTRQTLYSMVAQRTLDYTLRELTDEKGGFYCGQDADSDGIEGKYYVFTRQEIEDILGREEGAFFSDWYGVTDGGNFEGKNILNLLENPNYGEATPRIKGLSNQLYQYRFGRTHLHKDDKVLTSWNALAIAALAKAGRLLGQGAYLESAKKAQRFLENTMMDESFRLKLRWREGESAHAGQLDDYAFYAFALLELYQSTYEVDYLRQAIEISKQMLEQFWDEGQGGFFLYSKDSEQLISRPKEIYDGAIPAGNSVAAVVVESLAKLTGDIRWQEISDRQLIFLAGAIQDYPAGHSVALIAISKAIYPSLELVCVTAEEDMPGELSAFLAENALPNLTLLLKTDKNKYELGKLAPFTENYPIPESGTAYYLCQNNACSAPIYRLEELMVRLQP